MNPPPPHDLSDDPADEFQGDVHAADIVGPTGEEMPIATHAEVHQQRRSGSMHRASSIAAKHDTPSIRFVDPRPGGSA
jgi:hypothetical protein